MWLQDLKIILEGCFSVRLTSNISRQLWLTPSSSRQVQAFDHRP